jgi:hypothetical protein
MIDYSHASFDWSDDPVELLPAHDDVVVCFRDENAFRLNVSGSFAGEHPVASGVVSAHIPTLSGKFDGMQLIWVLSGNSARLWLDASDEGSFQLDAEGKVASWWSKTPNNYYAHTVSDMALSPTRVGAAVQFALYNYLVFEGASLDTFRNQSGYSIFFVAKRTGTYPSASFLEFTQAASLTVDRVRHSLNDHSYRSESTTCFTTNTVGSSTQNAISLQSTVADMTARTLYAGNNGTVTLRSSVLCADPIVDTRAQRAWLGRDSSTNQTYWFQGELYELFILPYAASVDERQRIEGALAWKWGINSSLDAAHPYKTIAPTPDLCTGVFSARVASVRGSVIGGVGVTGRLRGFARYTLSGTAQGTTSPGGPMHGALLHKLSLSRIYGHLPVVAILNGTLAPLTGEGVGFVPVFGSLSGAIQDITVSAIGGTDVFGELSAYRPLSLSLLALGGIAARGLLDGTIQYNLSGQILYVPPVSGTLDGVLSLVLSGRFFVLGAGDVANVYLEDTLNTEASFEVVSAYNFISTLIARDSTAIQTTVHVAPTDNAAFTDTCFSIHTVDLPTTLSVTDDLNAAVRAVLELAVLLEAQDTQTTSLSIAANLLETLVAQDLIGHLATLDLDETLDLSDQLSAAIRAQLALPETVRLRDELETALVVSIPLLTTATLLDTLGKLVSLVFDETATLTDSPILGATVKAGGTTTLNVSAISELLAVLGVSLDEQATLQAIQQLTQSRDVLFDETVALTDTQRVGVQMVLVASEQLAISDTGELAVSILARLNETVSLDDLATVSISTWLNLTDGAAFIARLPLDGNDYQAWVMNAETTGTTQYVNYPMNSLFTFQGVPYGVSETGLYRLEGETDDGDPINSVVATGDMSFGTSREKNIPRCYLYLTQTGQVVLKTISSRQGSRHETYYELAERTTDSTDDDSYRRVPLGRGVRGVWWRFELHALDGATINLDGAEIRPVVLSRRG